VIQFVWANERHAVRPWCHVHRVTRLSQCRHYAVITRLLVKIASNDKMSDLLHPVTSSCSSRSIDSLQLQTQRTRTQLGILCRSISSVELTICSTNTQRFPTDSRETFEVAILTFTSAFLVSA